MVYKILYLVFNSSFFYKNNEIVFTQISKTIGDKQKTIIKLFI
ncbi:hypothetical protein TGUWTKB_5780 [Candidatus Tachikawaea gelatinosa]|uniref:Uncharacterized protein n=1 Tax=Candidatus Tachikawaea gelatinosa TaxID=1410383 RepID=A0A090AK51_9ENTR|nr:hypothetical protein TGUWTKB_5780 [Candidatus Tachikawaea gelatinosa]